MNITLDGTSLMSGNYSVSGINYQDIPRIDLDTVDVSNREGFKILNQNLKAKSIEITGTIFGSDNDTLEQNIDAFKKLVNVTAGTLEITDASKAFHYVVTRDQVNIDRSYYNIKHAKFSVRFLALDPIAEKSTVIETLSAVSLTEAFSSWEVSLGGTYEPRPEVTYVIDTAGNLREIAFTNETTGNQISFGGGTAWNDGDEVVIDFFDYEIRLNGSSIDYDGIFPFFQTGANELKTEFTTNDKMNEFTDIDTYLYYTTQAVIPAQKFIPPFTGNIKQIKLYLSVHGTTTGNIKIQIRTDSGGFPTSTVVANGEIEIPKSSVPAGGGWVTITFTSLPAVTSGTPYWIVLQDSAGASSINYIRWYQGYSVVQNMVATYYLGIWSDSDFVQFGHQILSDDPASYSVDMKMTYQERLL